MKYKQLIKLSLERFRKDMVAEKWAASESELVNFYEKRGLIPEALYADAEFDLARICRESHVRNPYHTPGSPKGKTTHRRKADLCIWPADRMTTYGDTFTDPKYAPDVLMEFKVDVGEKANLSGLKREYANDLEKVQLACEQSPGMLGFAVWIDVPNGKINTHCFDRNSERTR